MSKRFYVLPSNIGHQVRDRETMSHVEENGRMLIFKSKSKACLEAKRLNAALSQGAPNVK